MQKQYILHDRPEQTHIEAVLSKKYAPLDTLNEVDAAILIKRHRVSLRVWRRTGQGPAYLQDGKGHRVLYRYADLMEWQDAHHVDPSTKSQTWQNLWKMSMGSDVDRVQFETGEAPSGDDTRASADEE